MSIDSIFTSAVQLCGCEEDLQGRQGSPLQYT